MITDRVGNTTGTINEPQLDALGYTTTFQVTGTSDRTPPQLTSVSVAPASVDVSATNQTVNMSVGASDDLSGVGSVAIEALLPNGTTYQTGAALVSGTPLNGIYTMTVPIPRYSPAGIGPVKWVMITDRVGNTTGTINEPQLGE